MNENYKNSYKSTEKELVSLAVYNVGYQKCNPKYQWGPGIRDHYLIHHIIAGKGRLKVNQTIYDLAAGDSFFIQIRKLPILRMNPSLGNMPGLDLTGRMRRFC